METKNQQPTETARDTRSAWAIDPAHSTIGFAVKHMMITTVRGRFLGISGAIRLDDDHPQTSSVEVEIDAATIDTGDPKRDEHLRSADFLDVATYPTITFRSTHVEPVSPLSGERWTVVGELTIRGVTRSVELAAEASGRGSNPWGAEVAGFEATTKINRKDYGLTWNVSLETGGWLVGDEVKVTIDVEAARQG